MPISENAPRGGTTRSVACMAAGLTVEHVAEHEMAFAERYSACTARDHETLLDAITDGRLPGSGVI